LADKGVLKSMNYIYITNCPKKAELANESNVDFVMVDLELIGKEKRQGHLNTLISRHEITDIPSVKAVLGNSKLLVRTNPIFSGSKNEIDMCIANGADMLMLPMFTRPMEVESFIRYINGRAKVCLLFETPQSLIRADEILSIKGIDQVHLGLNDLHLAMKLDFMFELLSSGIVEFFADKCKESNIPFGFGGIAPIGRGKIDSSIIAKEHYRIGSEFVILSRDFHNNEHLTNLKDTGFRNSFCEISTFFENLNNSSELDLIENKRKLKELVMEVVYA